MQDRVVDAGDQLAAGPADDAGTSRQPRVPIARSECPLTIGATRGMQRVEVGGEVDVHVDEYVGVRGLPHALERAAAALLLQADEVDPAVLVGQSASDQRGPVGRGVVGDGDPPGPGQGVEVRRQRRDRDGERDLLVVDGHDHLEHGRRLHGLQSAHWTPRRGRRR